VILSLLKRESERIVNVISQSFQTVHLVEQELLTLLNVLDRPLTFLNVPKRSERFVTASQLLWSLKGHERFKNVENDHDKKR
jgi:hypothetical protein